jgi:hypothetical protein
MEINQMEKLLRELFSLLNKEEVNDEGNPRRVTQLYCAREADRMALNKILSDLKGMVS